MCHAVRASTGTVWETCMYVWPSCVTGTPSGITSHQALPTIWPYPLAFETQQHAWAAPNPPSKCPFALMQPPQLLTAHMFPVTGVILVWPPLSEQYHCLRSTCLQILIWTTSPAVTKGTEKNTQRRVEPSNTPNGRKKKKVWRGVWWIFNFGEISNIIGEGGRSAAAAESPASCQESGSNLHSEDKTSFRLWLNYWWIILLFRCLLPGEAKSVFR